MKLNPVSRTTKTSNRYCGPAVISAITKADTKETAAVIRLVSGMKAVRGTSIGALRSAFSAYGVSMIHWGVSDKPTLAKWLRDNKDQRKAGEVFLLVAGNHWQLVSGRRYVCGITKDIVSIKDKRVKRRARVTHVWKLHANSIRLRDDVRKKLEQKSGTQIRASKIASKASRLKRIAESLDVDVDRERFDDYTSWWVYPGESWASDPREDVGHHATDHWELVSILEEYIEAADTCRKT